MNEDYRDVEPLLRPRAIAIVGASPRPGSWSAIIYQNLRRFGYPGPITLVNPNHDELWGERCYPSLAEVPDPVDHAVVLVPAGNVLDVLRQAEARGLRSANVLSGGFGEGEHPTSRAQGEALAAFLRTSRLRLCGPNCMGNVSVRERVVTLADRRLGELRAGNLALVAQSGGLLGALYRACNDRGIGFSYLISSGNEADCDLADYLWWLVHNPETRAIGLFVEGIRSPSRFRAACEAALAADKPVLALKAGWSERGLAAAYAHTSALAGSDVAFDALARQVGLIRVVNADDFVETAELVLHARRPRGPRVGAITYSGGLRTLVADLAQRTGVPLPDLSPVADAHLRAILPVGTSVGNPLDSGWGGLSSQDIYLDCVRTLLAEPDIDVLLLQEELPRASDHPQKESTLTAVDALAAESKKPIVIFSIVSHSVTDHGRTVRARCPHLPFLQEVEKTLRAVRHLSDYTVAAEAARRAPERRRSPAAAAEGLASLLAKGRAVGEREVKQLLAAYGLSVVAEEVATSAEEAVAAAERLGYPVVLKVWSTAVLHKTDIGGVRLNLSDAAAVREAYAALKEALALAAPDAYLEGVLVQPQLNGVEVLLGIQHDPQFGPLVVVGAGGVLAEILNDVATRLAPLSADAARAAIAETRLARMLAGVRGKPPADVEAVVDALVRLSELAVDAGPGLAALDVNPLIVGSVGEGARVVDALLVPAAATVATSR